MGIEEVDRHRPGQDYYLLLFPEQGVVPTETGPGDGLQMDQGRLVGARCCSVDLSSIALPGPYCNSNYQQPPHPDVQWSVVGVLSAALVSAAILLPRTFFSSPNHPQQPLTGGQPSFCQVPLPRQWLAELAGNRTPVSGVSSVPLAFAIGPGGGSYFAEYYSPAWSGVVEVARGSGAMRHIFRFPSSQYAVVSGAFDGRWLVWTLSETRVDPVPATLMDWNLRSGQVSTLVPYAGSASVITFTLDTTAPGAGEGWLAWTIIPGGVGGGGYFLADLSQDTSYQLHIGEPPGFGFFVGDLFIYDVGGLHPHTVDGAVRMGSWTKSSVPEKLASRLHALRFGLVASLDPSGAAWSDSVGQLWLWSVGEPAAVKLQIGTGVSDLVQAGPYVIWGYSSGSEYVADLASGSYARLPISNASDFAAGDAVLFTWSPSPATQKAHPLYTSSVLITGSLNPLPRC